MGFGDNLAQDLHKVPPWGWAAFAAAGVGVFFYARSKANSGNTTSATPADTAALAGLYSSSGGTVTGGSGTSTDSSNGGGRVPTGGIVSGGIAPDQPPVVRDPLPPNNVTTTPPPAPPRQTYKVQSGDVLWSIGSKYGKSADDFYNANEGTIEDTAHQHGFVSSEGGHWIFPGEVLVVPQ